MRREVKERLEQLQLQSKERAARRFFTPPLILSIPKQHKEYFFAPDRRKPLVRPPAEYSNKTPYGIADELHRKTG